MKWLIEAGMEKDRSKRFYQQLGEEIVAAYYHKVSVHVNFIIVLSQSKFQSLIEIFQLSGHCTLEVVILLLLS
jgi:hypothetical protein